MFSVVIVVVFYKGNKAGRLLIHSVSLMATISIPGSSTICCFLTVSEHCLDWRDSFARRNVSLACSALLLMCSANPDPQSSTITSRRPQVLDG